MTVEEVIARAIEPLAWAHLGMADTKDKARIREHSLDRATAALCALSEQGYAVVRAEDEHRQHFINGRRNGIKWAVAYLHEEAKAKKDWRARNLLNLAADYIGQVDKHKFRRAMLDAAGGSDAETMENDDGRG